MAKIYFIDGDGYNNKKRDYEMEKNSTCLAGFSRTIDINCLRFSPEESWLITRHNEQRQPLLSLTTLSNRLVSLIDKY